MVYTRAQIRSKIHQRCDIENSTHETDAETNGHIQDAAAYVHDFLISTLGSRYNTKTGTLATIANQATYDLPNDFYRPVSFGLLIDNLVIPISAYGDTEEVITTQGQSWGAGNMPRYTITTGQEDNWGIQFNPPPDNVRSIIARYHPLPPEYTADSGVGGSIDFPQNAVDLLILEAVTRIKDKEERDTSRYERERSMIQERIQAWASPADRANPEMTVDVSNRTGFYPYRPNRIF